MKCRTAAFAARVALLVQGTTFTKIGATLRQYTIISAKTEAAHITVREALQKLKQRHGIGGDSRRVMIVSLLR